MARGKTSGTQGTPTEGQLLVCFSSSSYHLFVCGEINSMILLLLVVVVVVVVVVEVVLVLLLLLLLLLL